MGLQMPVMHVPPTVARLPSVRWRASHEFAVGGTVLCAAGSISDAASGARRAAHKSLTKWHAFSRMASRVDLGRPSGHN